MSFRIYVCLLPTDIFLRLASAAFLSSDSLESSFYSAPLQARRGSGVNFASFSSYTWIFSVLSLQSRKLALSWIKVQVKNFHNCLHNTHPCKVALRAQAWLHFALATTFWMLAPGTFWLERQAKCTVQWSNERACKNTCLGESVQKLLINTTHNGNSRNGSEEWKGR